VAPQLAQDGAERSPGWSGNLHPSPVGAARFSHRLAQYWPALCLSAPCLPGPLLALTAGTQPGADSRARLKASGFLRRSPVLPAALDRRNKKRLRLSRSQQQAAAKCLVQQSPDGLAALPRRPEPMWPQRSPPLPLWPKAMAVQRTTMLLSAMPSRLTQLCLAGQQRKDCLLLCRPVIALPNYGLREPNLPSPSPCWKHLPFSACQPPSSSKAEMQLANSATNGTN